MAGTQKRCEICYVGNSDWRNVCGGVGNGWTRSWGISSLGLVPTMATPCTKAINTYCTRVKTGDSEFWVVMTPSTDENFFHTQIRGVEVLCCKEVKLPQESLPESRWEEVTISSICTKNLLSAAILIWHAGLR